MALDHGPAKGWTWEPEQPIATSPDASESGSSVAPAMVAAGEAVPVARTAAEAIFTSPTLPQTTAAVGRGVGAVAAPIVGAVKGGPLGAAVGAAEMAKASWAGGKTGYYTGKMIQNASEPVAKALAVAAPYAQALSTLGGAQGLLDLVQMADPKRKDLGFLGVSLNDPHDPEHPALVNAAVKYVLSKLDGWQWSKMKNLVMQEGLDEIAALKQVLAK